MSMARVLVIGATGNIGAQVVSQIRAQGSATVICASRNGEVKLDIGSEESVAALAEQVPEPVDSVVICCGASTFGPAGNFNAESWTAGITSKLVSVTRLMIMLMNNEISILKDNGSIVITAGQASRTVNKMWPNIATNNAGLEAFVKNAGVDAPRGIRINAVSPPLITETAVKAGLPTAGSLAAADCAAAYLPLIFGTATAQVVDVGSQVAFEESHQA